MRPDGSVVGPDRQARRSVERDHDRRAAGVGLARGLTVTLTGEAGLEQVRDDRGDRRSREPGHPGQPVRVQPGAGDHHPRLAHPGHGGASVGAAERIAELTEARELLLADLAYLAD